ncbi:hypothetical protein [Ligilactobacillus ceti]|uniref:rRNA biogenesis protein rrp5 n=1 Tax=Ligilactobacillus ceti DSM 22408 TaxID=1122146 RepID=A0A0R2KHB5_9LACO|nr:hypothetical protein [Ligilactobacillus ceti]KRN88735.1 hypothetical protein IV53_GL000703 [Ligilactobacillus ceti DSM 22408]
MEKEKLVTLANELKKCSKMLEQIASKLLAEEETKSEKVSSVSFEGLRGILADKSRKGHTKAIKEIILSLGVNRLSEVKKSDYDSLLEKVKELEDE